MMKEAKKEAKNECFRNVGHLALAICILCIIQMAIHVKVFLMLDKNPQLVDRVPKTSVTSSLQNIKGGTTETIKSTTSVSPGHRLKMKQISQTIQEYGIPPPQAARLTPPEGKAVLVLMSHSRQRSKNVDMLLWAYSQMPKVLSKIVFVWNNPDEDPPDLYDYGEVSIIKFLSKTNHMTNRFLAPTQLATKNEAILLVDDDVFLTAGLISTMLQKWHGCYKLCLVGLDPRYVDPVKRQWTWKGGPSSNLVIGKTSKSL